MIDYLKLTDMAMTNLNILIPEVTKDLAEQLEGCFALSPLLYYRSDMELPEFSKIKNDNITLLVSNMAVAMRCSIAAEVSDVEAFTSYWDESLDLGLDSEVCDSAVSDRLEVGDFDWGRFACYWIATVIQSGRFIEGE